MAASLASYQQAAGFRSSPWTLARFSKPENSSTICSMAPLKSNWSGLTTRQELRVNNPRHTAPALHANKWHASVNVRAEGSAIDGNSSCVPATFFKVEAILRPWRVTYVTQALLGVGIRGATIYDVRGFGSQGAFKEREAGSEFSDADFLAKVKLEIVVVEDQVETVIDAIIDASRTGEFGDGKIFVSPVTEIIRIRTGERGLEAERMKGGRADQLAQKQAAS
eukprot:TRINITY_DN3344_c0_g1_i1.p1 TRINITY_DN3344_c0_g1~~TRINITY_DN3344_c0_g1_i1.p1  ORF type:complete len:223 (+),score=36.17 TRINITY_DN3344_c0_g1_i1:72-740(+)